MCLYLSIVNKNHNTLSRCQRHVDVVQPWRNIIDITFLTTHTKPNNSKKGTNCKAKSMVKNTNIIIFQNIYIFFSSFFPFLVLVPTRYGSKKLIKYAGPSRKIVSIY